MAVNESAAIEFRCRGAPQGGKIATNNFGIREMSVLSAGERKQLAAIAADRNRPRKHVERAPIVLASADRQPAQQVAQSLGVSRPTVWRWQQRFAESGLKVCFATRPASPASRPLQPIPRRGWWR